MSKVIKQFCCPLCARRETGLMSAAVVNCDTDNAAIQHFDVLYSVNTALAMMNSNESIMMSRHMYI